MSPPDGTLMNTDNIRTMGERAGDRCAGLTPSYPRTSQAGVSPSPLTLPAWWKRQEPYAIGDCLELMKDIPDKSIDLILTDPPYSTPVITAIGRELCKNFADLSVQKQYCRDLRVEWERVLRKGGSAFVFCDARYYPVLFESFYPWITSHLVIWDKGRIGLGGAFRHQYECIFFTSPFSGVKPIDDKTYADIIRCSPIPPQQRSHGAEKPGELLELLINGFCRVGGVVLDPFLGSGSTLLACRKTARVGIGYELNPEYESTIRKRILADTPPIEKYGGDAP